MRVLHAHGVACHSAVLACLGGVQSAETSQRDVTATIRVDTQFVVLDALVENKKTGNTIRTLTAKDFQLSEDDVPQPSATSAAINYPFP